MSLESLLISSVPAVVLPVPHLVLLHTLGGLHVGGVAGHKASLNTISVSGLVLLIEVALLVAGFCKVQLPPNALGTNPLISFLLTRPKAAPLLSLAGAC